MRTISTSEVLGEVLERLTVAERLPASPERDREIAYLRSYVRELGGSPAPRQPPPPAPPPAPPVQDVEDEEDEEENDSVWSFPKKKRAKKPLHPRGRPWR